MMFLSIYILTPKTTEQCIINTSMVDDPRKRTEIACLKESLENKEITNFRLVPGAKMLANCLTKKGASSKELLQVIRSGLLKKTLLITMILV